MDASAAGVIDEQTAFETVHFDARVAVQRRGDHLDALINRKERLLGGVGEHCDNDAFESDEAGTDDRYMAVRYRVEAAGVDCVRHCSHSNLVVGTRWCIPRPLASEPALGEHAFCYTDAMTAKEALLELIPELSEEEATQLLAYANTLYDDEPLTDEERQQLFRIRAEMEAGEAVDWTEVKRQLNL